MPFSPHIVHRCLKDTQTPTQPDVLTCAHLRFCCFFRAPAGARRAAATRCGMGRHGAFQLSGEGQTDAHCGVAPQRSASEFLAKASDVTADAARAQRRAAGRRRVPVHGGERRGQFSICHETNYCPDRYVTV